VEIGAIEGSVWCPTSARIDTRFPFGAFPRAILEGVGVRDFEPRAFLKLDGSTVTKNIVSARLRLAGEEGISLVIAEDGGVEPYIGHVNLLALALEFDAEAEELKPAVLRA
jgi:predicted aspartyl protease